MQIIFKNCCILFAIFGAFHFQKLGHFIFKNWDYVWRFDIYG